MIIKFDRNQISKTDYVSEFKEKAEFCFLKFESKNF